MIYAHVNIKISTININSLHDMAVIIWLVVISAPILKLHMGTDSAEIFV